MIVIDNQNIPVIKYNGENISKVIQNEEIIWALGNIIESCFSAGRWLDNYSWNDNTYWRDK